MIKNIGRLLVFMACYTPLVSQAGFELIQRDTAPVIAPEQPQFQPSMPDVQPLQVNPGWGNDAARIQEITNSIMQSPAQTRGILWGSMGIDTTKINFDQFMEIVNRGNYQEIHREISILYTNKDAFNSGTFTGVSYYQNKPVISPIQASNPRSTRYAPRILSNPMLYAGIGAAAAGAGVIAMVASGGGGDGGRNITGLNPDGDVFDRNILPYIYNPADFVDAEFSSYPLDGLSKINAQFAFAKGLTGAGVNVGFHDSFSDDSSTDPELNSRIIYRNLNIPDDTDFMALNCFLSGGDPAACNHGGVVMAFASNARNESGTVGVAPEANLMMNSFFASNVRILGDNGAQIVNFSCGGCATLGDLQYLANQGILMTSATGNDGTANPSPSSPAALASLFDYQLIAVTGAIDIAGSPSAAPYDRCGDQKQFCMTAYADNGTSFSAPQVAGTAAIIKQGWSFLTARQIGLILLNSAKDIGAPGIDDQFGHGLLDLKAATEPLGSVRTLSGNGTTVAYTPSVIHQNRTTAFGNAFAATGNAKGTPVVIDAYGRDFAIKPQDNLVVGQSRKFTPEMMGDIGQKREYKKQKLGDKMSFTTSHRQGNTGRQEIISFAEYGFTPSSSMTMGFSTAMDAIPQNEKRKFNAFNFISADMFQNGFLNFSDNNQVFHQAMEFKLGSSLKTKVSNFYSKNSNINYFNPQQDMVTSDFASTMAETRFSPHETFNINVKNGVTHEFASLLGTRFSGSFDMGEGANTYFTGVDVSYDIGANWNLFGTYLFGATAAQPASRSSFNKISNLTSDGFAITATKSELLGNDSLSFAIGQPTRVRSGTASGITPQVDRNTGEVSVVDFQQSLVPTGRNLQFQIAYQKEVTEDMGVNLAFEYESQPFQQRYADYNASALAKIIYQY